jgi:hypothetical protein
LGKETNWKKARQKTLVPPKNQVIPV